MIPKDHIYTYSGVSFSPLSPCVEDILPADVAHALSYMCRANGHFKSFYSVAQHCLQCEAEARARGYSREVRLACLIHDASEAFISDITRPVKRTLTQYKEIEERLQRVIYQRFGIDPDDKELMAAVSEIDDAMLYYEFLELGGLALFDTAPDIKSSPDYGFQPFAYTEKKYLDVLNELFITEELI